MEYIGGIFVGRLSGPVGMVHGEDNMKSFFSRFELSNKSPYV